MGLRIRKRFLFVWLLLLQSVAAFAQQDSVESESVFLRAIPSKPVAYLGEVISVEYRLFYKRSIVDAQTERQPLFNGFYSKQLDVGNAVEERFIKGKKYSSRVLKKYLLIANVTGELNLARLQVEVKLNEAAAADDFFEQERLVSKQLQSIDVSIRILPLPNKTRLNFNDGIGDFKFERLIHVDKQKDRVARVELRINGSGNLKMLHLAPHKAISGLELFNETGNLKETYIQNQLRSAYLHHYELIAQYNGDYVLPAQQMTFFNPVNGSYYVLKSEAIKWSVRSSKPAPVKVMADTDMHTKKYLGWRFFSVANLGVKFLLSGIVLFLLGLGLHFWRIFKLDHANANLYARKLAFKSLKKLKGQKLISEDDFSKRLSLVFNGYLRGKGFLVGQDLVFALLPDSLKKEGFHFLSSLDAMRFGGVETQTSQAERIEKLKDIIIKMDKY